MKYTVKPTTKFQKDLKRIHRRGYNISLLTDIIKKLANGEQLPEENHDHAFVGNEQAVTVICFRRICQYKDL